MIDTSRDGQEADMEAAEKFTRRLLGIKIPKGLAPEVSTGLKVGLAILAQDLANMGPLERESAFRFYRQLDSMSLLTVVLGYGIADTLERVVTCKDVITWLAPDLKVKEEAR